MPNAISGDFDEKSIKQVFGVYLELLLGLGRIENNSAQQELLRILNSERTTLNWRSLAREHLLASIHSEGCGTTPGEGHLAHPARADFRDDAVMRKSGTGWQCLIHCSSL